MYLEAIESVQERVSNMQTNAIKHYWEQDNFLLRLKGVLENNSNDKKPEDIDLDVYGGSDRV